MEMFYYSITAIKWISSSCSWFGPLHYQLTIQLPSARRSNSHGHTPLPTIPHPPSLSLCHTVTHTQHSTAHTSHHSLCFIHLHLCLIPLSHTPPPLSLSSLSLSLSLSLLASPSLLSTPTVSSDTLSLP